MAMTEEKVLYSVKQIENALRDAFPSIVPQQNAGATNSIGRLRHLRWMCTAIPLFLQEGRREKAMRWLGFLQGSAWVMRVRTVEDMKNDNTPEDSDL